MSSIATATALAWGAAGSLLLALRARRRAKHTSPGNKPLDHIVFFRLTAFPPNLQAALRSLNSIAGVIDVSVGPTFSTARSWGYTHGIVIRLENRQALGFYATHPQHLAVKSLIVPFFDEGSSDVNLPPVLALDIECNRFDGDSNNSPVAVTHVVPICIRPDCHPSCTSCKLLDRRLEEGARRMAQGIPGIVDVTFGRSFTTERSRGYTHVLNVRFVDKAAGDAYQPHDLHSSFKEILKGNLSSAECTGPVACLDWESIRK